MTIGQRHLDLAARAHHLLAVKGTQMPLTAFLVLIASVIAAAGVTVALWAVAGLPLVALGVAALAGSLVLGWQGLRR